jgi:hypothetical protein
MATTTNYGWTTPDDTSLVKDGAAAIRTLGSSVDTTTKALNPSTTLGDIEYRSATANTNTRLAIGSSGQVLAVSAGVPAWVTMGSNAAVQVIGATSSTQVSTTSSTYVDSNLTVTITPTSASNRVLILVSSCFETYRAGASCIGFAALFRGATQITGDAGNLGINIGSSNETETFSQFNLAYLDSPATTSATTYKVQVKGVSGTRIRTNSANTVGSIIAIEVTP